MPFKLTFIQVILIWFGLGLLGATLLLFIAWFGGYSISLGDIVISYVSGLAFGVLLLLFGVLALLIELCIPNDIIIIRGKPKT